MKTRYLNKLNMFPVVFKNNIFDGCLANPKKIPQFILGIFSSGIQFPDFYHFFFSKFSTAVFLASRKKIMIKGAVTLFTQSFIVENISKIFSRDIRPFISFCRSCSALRAIFWFTKLACYPCMQGRISNIIPFPLRIIFSGKIMEAIKTFSGTIFSISLFYTRKFCFNFFSTIQAIFNYKHLYLQTKWLCSACFEVTVRLLTHTKSHILNIKNPLPQSIFIIYFLFILSIPVFAQPAPCIFEWCGAILPKTAGEKVTGKDNCGNYCSKHGIAVAVPTAPPVAAKPETAIVPKEEVIVQPAKDGLGKTGNVEGITVTLSTNARNEPVLTAICPASGFNEWDYKMFQAGYKQKVVKRDDEVFIIYEKCGPGCLESIISPQEESQ